jgi:N-acetylmuramic acid 6-phosphate etherase
MTEVHGTEGVNPLASRLEGVSTLAWLEAMHDDGQAAFVAVRRALPDIARLADQVAGTLNQGGRFILAGAGTSGRLAALEAAECPPTFGIDPDSIVALVAGGPHAMSRAVEGAEDDEAAGRRDLLNLRPCARDLAVGVSASGSAPYVRAIIVAARQHGAQTAAIVCNPDAPLAGLVDLSIVLLTGPEFVAGSTRLKAGTAQKLALNLTTTGAMRSLGRVRAGRMVALRATNAKLWGRAIGIVADIAQVDRATAEQLLHDAEGDVAIALAQSPPTADHAMQPDLLQVKTRGLRAEDAAAVLALASEPGVVATTAPFATLGGMEHFQRWLSRPGNMLGAFDDERLIGVLLAEQHDALLREHVLDVAFVAVADQARGRGVGDRLVSDTLRWATTHGLTRVELRVWPDNLAAIRLYERHGFEIEGRIRRHAIVDGREIDALLMAWLMPR